MVHVGQLNKAMQYNLPGFEQLAKEGEEEAASQLEDDFDDIDDEIESALDDVEKTPAMLDDEPTPIENPDEIEELEQNIKPIIPQEKAKEAPAMLDDDEPLPVDVGDDELI